jgi:hypothetical protein
MVARGRGWPLPDRRPDKVNCAESEQENAENKNRQISFMVLKLHLPEALLVRLPKKEPCLPFAGITLIRFNG